MCSTYGHQIYPAKNEDDNARSNRDLPERQAKRFLTVRLLVEVVQDISAQDQHGDGQSNKAMLWAEQWPVTRVVALKEGEL